MNGFKSSAARSPTFTPVQLDIAAQLVSQTNIKGSDPTGVLFGAEIAEQPHIPGQLLIISWPTVMLSSLRCDN
jgi:hypothetical protein